MKTKFIVNNDQRGFSLIEVMIAVAIMSGVALTMSQMTSNQTANNKTIEAKMGMNSAMGEIKELLSQNTNCEATFGGKDLTTLPVSATQIFRSDGTTDVLKKEVGKVYENNTIKLSSVQITSWTPDPGNPLLGEMVIRVTWEKQGKYIGPQFVTNDINMRATIDGSNKITDCYTSYGNSSGSEIWQPHNDGIYYDDGTSPIVAIGMNPVVTDNAILQVDGSARIGRFASVTDATGYALGGIVGNPYGIGVGDYSLASGNGALSIGGSAASNTATTASAEGAIAIGAANTWAPSASWGYNVGARATGMGSIAIGSAIYDSTLTYFGGADWLEGAKADGNGSIAIGGRADAPEHASIAIGVMSETGGNTAAENGTRPGGVTMGFFSYATDSYTTSLGYRARSGQLGSSATGDDDVDNSYAVALGAESGAWDHGSIALGGNAVSGQYAEDNATTPNEGDYTIAVGYSSKAYDQGSIAIGHLASSGHSTLNTSDPLGIAIGVSSISSDDYAIAIGNLADADKIDSIAIGRSSAAHNNNTIAIGESARSSNLDGIAIGQDALVDNDYSVAIGYSANASSSGGDGGIAIGKNSYAQGFGIAIGNNTNARTNSMVFGKDASSMGSNNIVFKGSVTNSSAARNVVIGGGASIGSNTVESMVISLDPASSLGVIASNKFRAYFANGYEFCTGTVANPCTEGFEIRSNGSTADLSDRNAKTNLELVDPELVVEQFLGLDIFWWNYKSALEPENRLIGPMAQDFKKAFGTFGDDKHINNIDSRGVTMAGIKGLAIKNQKLEARIEQLEEENLELKNRLDRLEALVEKLDK